VQGVTAFASVLDIPGDVELAAIAVPAANVPAVVDECGRKGVRALVVISSGFGEVGPEGIERQHELMEIVRAHGMRLIGPNCMGITNSDPEVN
jgi:acyl-CoA synthetase (NDP forming)